MPYTLKKHIQQGKSQEGYIKTYCGLTLKNLGDILRKCDPKNAPCENCLKHQAQVVA